LDEKCLFLNLFIAIPFYLNILCQNIVCELGLRAISKYLNVRTVASEYDGNKLRVINRGIIDSMVIL